jgi:hypothetical protein
VSELTHRAHYVGAPEYYELDSACVLINDAFGGFGCYHVGSSLHRQNWRDVDVRYILRDGEWSALFADANPKDPSLCARWVLLSRSISLWLSQRSGLPVDFQFQQQSSANEEFSMSGGHLRSALGFAAYHTGMARLRRERKEMLRLLRLCSEDGLQSGGLEREMDAFLAERADE